MITPTSGSLTVPTQTFNGIWIKSIMIQAPSPTSLVSARIVVCPYNSISGSLAVGQNKTIFVPDVMTAAASSSLVANVMGSIYAYVQDQVVSKSLF